MSVKFNNNEDFVSESTESISISLSASGFIDGPGYDIIVTVIGGTATS